MEMMVARYVSLALWSSRRRSASANFLSKFSLFSSCSNARCSIDLRLPLGLGNAAYHGISATSSTTLTDAGDIVAVPTVWSAMLFSGKGGPWLGCQVNLDEQE